MWFAVCASGALCPLSAKPPAVFIIYCGNAHSPFTQQRWLCKHNLVFRHTLAYTHDSIWPSLELAGYSGKLRFEHYIILYRLFVILRSFCTILKYSCVVVWWCKQFAIYSPLVCCWCVVRWLRPVADGRVATSVVG